MTSGDSVSTRVPTASRLVWEPGDGRLKRRPDELAVEEPLEIRAAGSSGASSVLNVTMRTPGSDFELAAGWLLGEGVLHDPAELRSVRYCTDPELDAEQRYNAVTADLDARAYSRVSRDAPSRLTATTSACGVCGSASISALAALGPRSLAETPFRLSDVLGWPDELRRAQAAFTATGGLHAAGLVSADGELCVVREDIGRHNAVDKVIGWAVLEAAAGRGGLPLSRYGLVVSGRTSFEIVQKALAAGIPLVAGVSAASSLAARLAAERGLTLLGFVRNGRCTVYSCPERLAGSSTT